MDIQIPYIHCVNLVTIKSPKGRQAGTRITLAEC